MRGAACLSVFALTLAVEDPMVLVNSVQLTQSGGGPPAGEFEYRYGDGDTVLLLCVSMDTRCTVQWLDYALYDVRGAGGLVSAVGVGLRTTLRAPHHRTRLVCHYVCPETAPRTFAVNFIHASNFSDILKLTINDLTMRPQAPRSHVKYTINYANNERLTFKCVTNRDDVVLKAEHQGRQWQARKETSTHNEMILLTDDMSSDDSIDDEDQAQLQYCATAATGDDPLYSIQITFVKLPEVVTYKTVPTVNLAEDNILLKSYEQKENQQIFRGYKDGNSFRLSCGMSNKNDRVLDANGIETKNNVVKSIHLISAHDYDIELRCVSAVTSRSSIDVPAPSNNVNVQTRSGVPAPATSGDSPTSTDTRPLPSSDDLSTTPRSERVQAPLNRVGETPSSARDSSMATDDDDGAQRMDPWAVAVPAAAGVFCVFVVCAVVAVCVMVKRFRRVQEGYGDNYYGDLQTATAPSPRACARVAPRLEPHYAAPVDQREDKAIYCEPWQPDGPTTTRGRGSTPGLNYAVLDISPSSEVAHTVVSDQSPYAEVRHDGRAAATVKTTEEQPLYAIYQ